MLKKEKIKLNRNCNQIEFVFKSFFFFNFLLFDINNIHCDQ